MKISMKKILYYIKRGVGMSNYYEHLCNANDINMVLDNINGVFDKSFKNMFSTCHGRYHAEFVVDKTEYILKSLSYDSRTIELGKVAALLHDIGMITGRWEHAKKSAVLSEVIFDGLDHLSPEEKKMLIQAIENHNTNEMTSAIGAALYIADKIDCSKNRILPVEIVREADKTSLKIEKVDLHISNKSITINLITTRDFPKEQFVKAYKKTYSSILKRADFLGCTCQFQFNGAEENFAA